MEYRRGNARSGEYGEVEARMRSQRKGPLGRDAARDEGGERREQREETRRVGKRSRLPVSIDPPRRSRAHLVFHPSSVAISLYHEKVRERVGKGKRMRMRDGQKENRHIPVG